jgi:hypothetical protein
MQLNDEMKEFYAEFVEAVMEITVVTGVAKFSHVRPGGCKYWESYIQLTAWKLTSSEKIYATEDSRLIIKGDDKYLEETEKKILPNTVYTLKVRKREGKHLVELFTLVEIIDKINYDKELEDILEEQKKPVIYHDETLGDFLLDKEFNWYFKKIKWDDKDVRLIIPKYEGKRQRNAFIIVNEFFREQSLWDIKIKEFAGKKLLKLKNNNWLTETNEKKLAMEEFTKRIKVLSIKISLKNKFEMDFDDGNIFLGHTIIVSGNLEKGPIKAELYG